MPDLAQVFIPSQPITSNSEFSPDPNPLNKRQPPSPSASPPKLIFLEKEGAVEPVETITLSFRTLTEILGAGRNGRGELKTGHGSKDIFQVVKTRLSGQQDHGV